MYVGFAGLFSLLASQLVLPTPAGMLARGQLATALRGSGELLWRACDIATGPLGADGRLKAATGRQAENLSMDAGLAERVMPLHNLAAGLGSATQVGGGTCGHVAARSQETGTVREEELPGWRLSIWAGALPAGRAHVRGGGALGRSMCAAPRTCCRTPPFGSWRCWRAPCSGNVPKRHAVRHTLRCCRLLRFPLCAAPAAAPSPC